MFKRISKIFLISLISFASILLLSPSKVEAAKIVTGDYTLGREEILHDDLFIGGTTAMVEINGIVDGDVYIGADGVTITGTVSDDVYVVADTVTVSGNVYGDLVAFGSTVTVSGSIGESAYLTGGAVESSGSIVDDLVVIGGDVETSGYVDEDLIAVGMSLDIQSTIAEDLVAFGTGISTSNASVSGETYKEEGKFYTQDIQFFTNPNLSWGTVASTALITGISVFLVGAFLIYVMPVKTLNIVKKSTESGDEFIKSFATGFIILFIASIPTFLLLSLTVVGLPLAGILFALVIFLAMYARIWVEIGIGNLILKSLGKKKYSFYLALLVGRFLSVVINLIPIVGTIYTTVITLVGAGAFFRMKYDLMSPAKSKKKVAKKKVSKKKSKK